MFNDMKVSVDTMNEFKNYLQKPGISVRNMVVSGRPSDLILSPESQHRVICYRDDCNVLANDPFQFALYDTAANEQNMQTVRAILSVAAFWQTVDMAVLPRKRRCTESSSSLRKHDLNVSTFALVILLLFEDVKDDDFLSYKVWTSIPLLGSDYRLPTGNSRVDFNRSHRSQTSFAIFSLRQV